MDLNEGKLVGNRHMDRICTFVKMSWAIGVVCLYPGAKPMYMVICTLNIFFSETAWPISYEMVQVGNDQEKAQSERDSHSKIRGGKNSKLTIRHPHHENAS